MPEAIYLIGPPACGKSTFTENHSKKFQDKNYVVISSDNIIEQKAKEWNVKYFQAIMRMKQVETYDQLIKELNEAVLHKRNLIIDRTNLSYRERYLTMKHLPEYYKRIGIIFRVNYDTLRFRLKMREILTGKHIPDIVVERMFKNFEFPHGREFHDLQIIYS